MADKIDAARQVVGGTSTGTGTLTNTDQLPESATPTNKYFTEARTLAAKLADYGRAAAGRAIAVSDSILIALGVLEKKTDDNAAGLLSRLNNRDNYANNTDYVKNDVFAREGSLFYVLTNHNSGTVFNASLVLPFAVLPAVPPRTGVLDFTQEAFYGASQTTLNPIPINVTGAKSGVAVKFTISVGGACAFPTVSTAASGSVPIQVQVVRGTLIQNNAQPQIIIILYEGFMSINAVMTHYFSATVS